MLWLIDKLSTYSRWAKCFVLLERWTFCCPVLGSQQCTREYTATGDPALRPGIPQPRYSMAVTCYRFPSSCIIYLYSDCCRRTCCYVFVTFWRLIPLLSMQSCWGLAGSARAACSCGCCCCWCGWCCCWRCCTIGTIAVQNTAVFYAIVSLIYKDCCELRCNKCCRFLCCC